MIFLYNVCILFLVLVLLPKQLWQYGKYQQSFKQRLGFNLPKAKAPSIWIHMVSVGETRAMIPLYQRIKKAYPDTEIFLSTVTSTGLEEARRSLPDAAGYFHLPLDFSWTMRKLCKNLKPKLLILSEGDLWLNMLTSAKKQGARVVLVSGKLSQRSAKRYALVPSFAKRLFGAIDLICAQNTSYAERFKKFATNIHITGNLKLDISSPKLSADEKASWEKRLKLKKDQKVLVIGSTHPGEEQLILSATNEITDVKILIVPRHPERFDSVFALLPPSSGRLTQGLTGDERVVLIDQMGLLNSLYQLATLAIVGGSFVPEIGGHNVFEPIQAHIPVLFGPYTEKQTELVQLVLDANAGEQVNISELQNAIKTLLADHKSYSKIQTNATQLEQVCRGATERTWKVLFP